MGVDAIDITIDQRKTVIALLKRHLPGTAAWIYGSRVRWTVRPQSDLDLVVFSTLEQSSRVGDLREAFEESDLPFRVDLFVWDDLPQSFRDRIQAEHVAVTGSASKQLEVKQSSELDEWRETKLGDLVEIKHGFAFKGTYIRNTPHRNVLITPGNFAIGGGFKGGNCKYYSGVSLEEFMLSEGDLVVTMTDLSKKSDTLGYPAFLPECQDGKRYLHNQRIGKVMFKDSETDARYIFYLMCGREYRHEVLASATGTTVKHTSPDRIRQFRFRLPPIREQRAIGHILGTLDDKIELNRRMNETLEATARALFKSWFVDFEPVRAKMAGPNSGLPQHVADLFPDRLVNSDRDEVPKGWKLGTLKDVASLNPESWSPRNPPSEIVYVDLSNTKWGRIEKVKTYPWKTAPSRGRRILRHGDTIVGTVRPGNGSFALIDRDGFTGSTGFAVLRPKTPSDTELVWCAATCRNNIDRLAHLADGAAYPAVRPAAVVATRLALADVETRAEFSLVAGSLLNQIGVNRRQIDTLSTLRRTLLPKLVSGDIRTRSTSKRVEEIT